MKEFLLHTAKTLLSGVILIVGAIISFVYYMVWMIVVIPIYSIFTSIAAHEFYVNSLCDNVREFEKEIIIGLKELEEFEDE